MMYKSCEDTCRFSVPIFLFLSAILSFGNILNVMQKPQKSNLQMLLVQSRDTLYNILFARVIGQNITLTLFICALKHRPWRVTYITKKIGFPNQVGRLTV